MFLDGIARQRTWTFYAPREGETELGAALGQLVSGLIKSEKRELYKLVFEWLNSKNENLIYFASEIIGYFNTEFKELKESLYDLFKDLDVNVAWHPGQLNCIWAYSRLTDYEVLNNSLLKTDNEENQRWILVAYEQMVKAEETSKKADPMEFIPILQSFILSNASDSVIQRGKKTLEEFKCMLSPAN